MDVSVTTIHKFRLPLADSITMTPLISICATAAKPDCWQDFWNSIGEPTIPFEVVFVGPKPPLHPMPGNFRYIASDVKPVQAYECAWRAARGQFILHMADDLTFDVHPDIHTRLNRRIDQLIDIHREWWTQSDPGISPLDQLYETWLAAKNPKAIVSCRYMLDGVDYSIEPNCHVFRAHDMTSPTMPVGAFMTKALLEEIGGVDRNFVGVNYDLDIAMRALAAGGVVVLDPEVYVEELTSKGNNRLSAGWGWWSDDQRLSEKLWPKIDNWKTLKRSRPFQGFVDDGTLLLYSQGKRGRWRGRGPEWFERLENRFRFWASPKAPLFHLLAWPFSPWRWWGTFRRRILGRAQ